MKNDGTKIDTFPDIRRKKYSADTNHTGLAFCSEERILYNLKKTKNVDIAIIFHSLPEFYFIPTADRDFNKMTPDEMPYKIAHMNWYPEAAKDRIIADCKNMQCSDQEIIRILTQYQKFCITPDLLKNRFYGALMQIDQYVKFKNIKTLHCVLGSKSLPKWFKFSHGLVDYKLGMLQNQHLTNEEGDTLRDENNKFVENKFKSSFSLSNNAITPEGNQYIADEISKYIDRLLQS